MMGVFIDVSFVCDSSQRDDPGEVPQHSREAQEIAAVVEAAGDPDLRPSQCCSASAPCGARRWCLLDRLSLAPGPLWQENLLYPWISAVLQSASRL